MEIEEENYESQHYTQESEFHYEASRPFQTFNLLNIINHTKEIMHKFSPITAGDPLLDQYFKNGRESYSIHSFEPGKIYDFYGEAGSGKTNFGVHLAVQNAISMYNTEDDSLIYHISVGKSVSSKRYEDMVQSLKKSNNYPKKAIENFPTNVMFLEFGLKEDDEHEIEGANFVEFILINVRDIFNKSEAM